MIIELLKERNLCKEIMLSPPQMCILGYPKTTVALKRLMPKYQFSRAKWYEVEFHWTDYDEIVDWCNEQFGPHPTRADAWSRWVHVYADKIQFRDKEDYMLYVLRWGL